MLEGKTNGGKIRGKTRRNWTDDAFVAAEVASSGGGLLHYLDEAMHGGWGGTIAKASYIYRWPLFVICRILLTVKNI